MCACQVSNADAARADRREEVAIKTIAQGGCVSSGPWTTDQDCAYLEALRAQGLAAVVPAAVDAILLPSCRLFMEAAFVFNIADLALHSPPSGPILLWCAGQVSLLGVLLPVFMESEALTDEEIKRRTEPLVHPFFHHYDLDKSGTIGTRQGPIG